MLLLALFQFATLVDKSAIDQLAMAHLVPPQVAEAVAYSETGSGARWRALGPGTEVVGDDGIVRRTCREVGRYQLKPCINWAKRLGDPRCTVQNLRTNLAISTECGIENLSYLATHKCQASQRGEPMRQGEPRPSHTAGPLWLSQGDVWLCVIRSHNGSGPLADAYLLKALSYIGWSQVMELR